jgi:hypothetical protein
MLTAHFTAQAGTADAADVNIDVRHAAAMQGARDRAQGYLDVPDVNLLAMDLEGRIMLANGDACRKAFTS